MSDVPTGHPSSDPDGGLHIPSKQEANRLGTWGLALSLIAPLTCFLLSPVAALLSTFGLRREPNEQAKLGLIFGIVGTLLIPVLGMVVIVAMAFMHKREQRHQYVCRTNLAMLKYAIEARDRDQGSSSEAAPTLSELESGEYISYSPGCPGGGTYAIDSLDRNPTCTQSTLKDFPHTLRK